MEGSLQRLPEHGALEVAAVGKGCREQFRIRQLSSRPTKRRIKIRKPASRRSRKKLDDANARLLAVQSVFTDRRAYVNALTYELETSTSASAKASKQKEIDKYKDETGDGRVPDGSRETIHLPSTGRNLQRDSRRAHQAEPRTRRVLKARDRSQGQDG